MKSARAADEQPPRMSFVESFTQPNATDDLYCDDDDENENNDDDENEINDDDDASDDDGNEKQPFVSSSTPVEQHRRPSLVIAGDAQALESVRTVHSPKSQRTSTISPRPSVTTEAAFSSASSAQAASPKLPASHTVPSPIKPSQPTTAMTTLGVLSTPDRRGWRAVWAAKLAGTVNRLDLLASIALFVYSYHDCLDEQDECHEECLADPDTSLPLPLTMAGTAVAMFAVYGHSRPAALLEWAQTTMAVSWIQRMAPLLSVALVASHELHLTLVSDGTAAALAGFLVCRHRHRYHRDGNAWWTLAFLIVALCTGAVDVFAAGNGAIIEPVSVLVGVAVVVVAHVIVSTTRSFAGLDDDVVSDDSEDDGVSVAASDKKTQ